MLRILYLADFSHNIEKTPEFIKKLKESNFEDVVTLHVIDKIVEAYEAFVWTGKDFEIEMLEELGKVCFAVKFVTKIDTQCDGVLKVAGSNIDPIARSCSEKLSCKIREPIDSAESVERSNEQLW